MTTYLLFGNSAHDPLLRHEVGELVADPFSFIEHDGRRIVVGGPFERAIFERREDVVDEFWSEEELGRYDLVRDESFPEHLIKIELTGRALAKLGSPPVVVPPSFPLAAAQHLQEKGIEVRIDPEVWLARRRRKTPWELEGIERAQRAAETAMLTAARMLREAEPTASGQLRFEGEILTAELIRVAMSAELLSQGAESEQILIHSGDAWSAVHDPGLGPILPDKTCVIDCFPRDRRTGAFADMTRTFVPGAVSDDVKQLHAHCRVALALAFASLRPGCSDAYERVATYFHDHGLPTLLHNGSPLQEGFFHGLGHGVGLEVHERPLIGLRSDVIEEGDVVAVEPGLYFRGIGGVRLEDTVVVTDSGVEHFTDPYSYDLAP